MAALPLHYFLALREYLIWRRESERKAMDSANLGADGSEVIEF